MIEGMLVLIWTRVGPALLAGLVTSGIVLTYLATL